MTTAALRVTLRTLITEVVDSAATGGVFHRLVFLTWLEGILAKIPDGQIVPLPERFDGDIARARVVRYAPTGALFVVTDVTIIRVCGVACLHVWTRPLGASTPSTRYSEARFRAIMRPV